MQHPSRTALSDPHSVLTEQKDSHEALAHSPLSQLLSLLGSQPKCSSLRFKGIFLICTSPLSHQHCKYVTNCIISSLCSIFSSFGRRLMVLFTAVHVTQLINVQLVCIQKSPLILVCLQVEVLGVTGLWLCGPRVAHWLAQHGSWCGWQIQ